jgi:hypothetical protein
MKVMVALAVVLGALAAGVLAFTLGVAAGFWPLPDDVRWWATVLGVLFLALAPTLVVYWLVIRLYVALLGYLDRGHRGPNAGNP